MPVGAAAIWAVRSRKFSMFQRPSSRRTRLRLGSVRLSLEISMRPRSSELKRSNAVTSWARKTGSAPNAGSS